MPNKVKGESRDSYIKRCIPEVINDGTAKDGKQAYAICSSKFDEKMVTVEQLERKEFFIKSDTEEGDIKIISFVSEPAIQVHSELFNKQIEKNYFEFQIVDEEKQIITGPVLIPNKDILRYDKKEKKYFNCFFSEKSVEDAMMIFAKNNYKEKGFFKMNLEHDKKVYDELFIYETWKTGEEDKIYSMGYTKEEIPTSTWMVSFKIENKELWNKIKEIKEKNPTAGFSLEGTFFSIDENFEFVNVPINILPAKQEEKEIVPNTENLEKDKIVKELLSEIIANVEFDQFEKRKLINRILKYWSTK